LRDYVPLNPDPETGTLDPENPGQRLRSETACGLTWEGRDFPADLFADWIEPREARVEGVYSRSWFDGRPALMRRDWGQGRVYTLGTFPGEAFYELFLARRMEDAGCARIWPDPLPAAVEVAERRAPDGRRLVFLLNTGAESHRLTPPGPGHDLWQDERVDGPFELGSWGVRILRF